MKVPNGKSDFVFDEGRMSAVLIPAPVPFLDARAVKARADFLAITSRYTRLRCAGRQLVGLCPFHSERHPSLYVHPEKKVFYCFGCGAGGDLFDFVMLAEACDFLAALNLVNRLSGGASEGGPILGPPKRAGAKPPAFRRKAPLYSWKAEPRPHCFSPANRWPSVEDCAAERALFTCQKPDNLS